jgi:hypothetical protein
MSLDSDPDMDEKPHPITTLSNETGGNTIPRGPRTRRNTVPNGFGYTTELPGIKRGEASIGPSDQGMDWNFNSNEPLPWHVSTVPPINTVLVSCRTTKFIYDICLCKNRLVSSANVTIQRCSIILLDVRYRGVSCMRSTSFSTVIQRR